MFFNVSIELIFNSGKLSGRNSGEMALYEWHGGAGAAERGEDKMASFNPAAIKPASKSTEFNTSATNKRDPKSVLMASIDNQLAMFKDPKAEGKRWFTAGRAEIAFALRYSNKPLALIDSETKVVVPTDQFEGAMLYYKEQASKGAFDAQLATLAKAVEARGEKMKATRVAKKAEEKKP